MHVLGYVSALLGLYGCYGREALRMAAPASWDIWVFERLPSHHGVCLPPYILPSPRSLPSPQGKLLASSA